MMPRSICGLVLKRSKSLTSMKLYPISPYHDGTIGMACCAWADPSMTNIDATAAAMSRFFICVLLDYVGWFVLQLFASVKPSRRRRQRIRTAESSINHEGQMPLRPVPQV